MHTQDDIMNLRGDKASFYLVHVCKKNQLKFFVQPRIFRE
jgi:hypothetical protein